MDHTTDIEANIEHYRELLNLYMTPETRQTIERLLAKAEGELETLRSAAREGPSVSGN
jgi:hypothetical protein